MMLVASVLSITSARKLGTHSAAKLHFRVGQVLPQPRAVRMYGTGY